MSPVIVTIAYRHPSKEGMFLMINQQTDWHALPSALQTAFADKQEVVRFDMTPDKVMARVNGALLYQSLLDQGYFVQMPPADVNALYATEEAWIAEQETSHRH